MMGSMRMYQARAAIEQVSITAHNKKINLMNKVVQKISKLWSSS